MGSSNASPGRVAKAIFRLKLMMGFAAQRGNSWKDRARLFYYALLKPSLAWRRLVRYHPHRLVSFSARVAPLGPFQIHFRDNGFDMSTLVEFFSSLHVLIPPELPPLQPKVIYDIGANIGMASLFYATRFPKAAFFGFEPVPANVEVCRLNFRNLPGSQLFPWAVGAQSGTALFDFTEQDLRGGHLEQAVPGQGPNAGNRIEVPVVSIADLVAVKKLLPPDLVKIDVEGAELLVLEGLGEQARNVKRMLIETHGVEVDAACRRWLAANQFEILHSHQVAPGLASIWCHPVKG